MVEHVHLSDYERLSLSLQHDILAATVDADGDAEYHRQVSEILREGYTREYDDVFRVLDDELGTEECELVADILDMFRHVGHSVDSLDGDADLLIGQHASSWLRFGGFDANDRLEGRMLGYARYLVSHGQWDDLAEYFDGHHDRGNSHAPHLDGYRRMLVKFRPIWARKVEGARGMGGYDLTAEELKEIHEAFPYPR